jgi:lipoate-protein ligase A
MQMRFLDLTLATVAENLALDESLLLEAESGHVGEVLRLWEWTEPAVILGSGCRLAEDVDKAACLAGGVPILRRASGGGTVLLGRGCLCYSLVLSYDRSSALGAIRSSYIYILERIRDALSGVAQGITGAGTSDLAVGGRKFSGNAQQRKRSVLLHHGTLLYDFDADQVGRYLRLPARQPDYRGGRDHAAFLTSLSVHASLLRLCLRDAWEAVTECVSWPRDLVGQLITDKYLRAEWVERR